MATCFLFAQHFTDEACLSLRLDDQGKLDAPLERRTLSAFKMLQVNARTIIVLPMESSGLHKVELPWLGSRKARIAIPYALEEQVAQAVLTLHVSFDAQYYQNKQYLVVVTDKDMLINLIRRLEVLDIVFDSITLDWFALKAGETCVSETSLLIHDNQFIGALSATPAAIYLSNHLNLPSILQFNDSAPTIKNTDFASINGSFYEWIAMRLFHTKVMNLCQGELRHNTRQQTSARWYQVSGMLAGLWLVCFLAINGFTSYILTNKIVDVDQKIAVIYHDFFPDATHVINPKFRIEQFIKVGNASHDAALWTLLDKLASANQDNSKIEQLRYQNQVLFVTLHSSDFAALEALELRLQKALVKVTQAQASSHENSVLATLELRL